MADELPEETVLLMYYHHESEEGNGTPTSTSHNEVHPSSVGAREQQREGKDDDEGTLSAADILSVPRSEDEPQTNPATTDTESLCNSAVVEEEEDKGEGFEYCLSTIVEEEEDSVSDFKIQSPGKLFSATIGKMKKRVPLQKLLNPDSLKDIHKPNTASHDSWNNLVLADTEEKPNEDGASKLAQPLPNEAASMEVPEEILPATVAESPPLENDDELLRIAHNPTIISPTRSEMKVLNDDPLLDDLWKPQNISHQNTFVDKIFKKGWLRKKRTATVGRDAEEEAPLPIISDELLVEPSHTIELENIVTMPPTSNDEQQTMSTRKDLMMTSPDEGEIGTNTFQQSHEQEGMVKPHPPNTTADLDILSHCLCSGSDHNTISETEVYSMDGECAQKKPNDKTQPTEDSVSSTAESSTNLVRIYPAIKSVDEDAKIERVDTHGIILPIKPIMSNVILDKDVDLQQLKVVKGGKEKLEQPVKSECPIPSFPNFAEDVVDVDTFAVPVTSPLVDDLDKQQKPPKGKFKLLKFASHNKRSERSLWIKKLVGKDKKQDTDNIKMEVISESSQLPPQGSAKQIKEVVHPNVSRRKRASSSVGEKRDQQSSMISDSWDESTGMSFYTVDTAETSFDTTLSTISIEEEEYSDSSYGSIGESTNAYSDFHKSGGVGSQCDASIPNFFSMILKQMDQIFDCAVDTTVKNCNEDRKGR
jgi:hypothetical protein